MMNNKIQRVLSFLLIAIFISASSQNLKQLEIGDEAPMTGHQVEDVSGRTLTMAEVAKENGLLVIFTCNTCPWVSKWEDRYNPIANKAESLGIGVITLNPNENIRDRGESMDDMKARAKKMDYNFYYAMDKDHIIADAFGATRTPDVFLFDKNMKLVYKGAIDDNANSAEGVENPYLSNAIDELVAGSAISEPVTKAFGCTIKRTK